MSAGEWKHVYSVAWQRYYTPENAETIMRRVAATRANASNALFLINWFMGSINIEHIHPLESGLLRLKFRRDRRPSLPVEPFWSFSPKYFVEAASKIVRRAALYIRLRRIYLCIKHDPQRFAYTDIAMTRVARRRGRNARIVSSEAARAFVARSARIKEAQQGHGHEPAPMQAAE